jgi:hypothetical protein
MTLNPRRQPHSDSHNEIPVDIKGGEFVEYLGNY